MLKKITLVVADTMTAPEVAEAVVEAGVKAFGGAAGMVAILSDDGECLEVIGQRGYPASIVKPFRRLPLQHPTPATIVYQRCEPEYIETLTEFLDRYPQIATLTTSSTGTHALMCAPLLIDGRAIGVFGLTYREDRTFSTEERAALPAFAEQAAQALWRVIQRSSPTI